MKKIVFAVIMIGALIWAQAWEIIPPEVYKGSAQKLCCGRPAKPPAEKPIRIETETEPTQKMSQGKAFLILNSNDPRAMKEIINRLKKEGISVLLRWPTHCALIKATKEDEARLVSIDGVEAVYYQPIEREEILYKDEMTNTAIEYWNRFIRGEFDEMIPAPELEPPKNDMLIPPQNFRYQSDYMFGDVAACIFFPESDESSPNTENWTDALRNNVINEVLAGVNRWANWAANESPPVDLTFTVYYFNYTILPTSVEPILLNSYNDEHYWINDCMDDIGVPYYASYFDRVSWFNNWLRDEYSTDWAYSIFVANSYYDTDGCFADGYSAYAYLGGPHLQMTYDNDGYGISRMDWVCAHETGHNFYAFDEYSASGCYCTQSRNGYQNQNCDNSCYTNNTCVMRNAMETPVEYYTKGHIGWDPGVYTLSDDVTQPLGYPYPKARKYQYNQSSIYWAATGVRPNSGSDWDIKLFSDTGFGSQLASSSYGSTTVDFVVADYNHSPTGADAIYVSRYSGTSGATIEYENASESFSYPNSYSASWPAGDVVEMIDYYLSEPKELTFTLDITSGSADLGFGIFKSNGSSYYAGRSAMLAYADANGSGGDETFDVNLTSIDWYGVIVWANNANPADYTINAGDIGIAEKSKLMPAKEYSLKVWPNPCKGNLKIDWILAPQCDNAILRIFDAAGKLIKIFHGTSPEKITWNCKDHNGKAVAEGVYFIYLETEEFRKVEKIVLLK